MFNSNRNIDIFAGQLTLNGLLKEIEEDFPLAAYITTTWSLKLITVRSNVASSTGYLISFEQLREFVARCLADDSGAVLQNFLIKLKLHMHDNGIDCPADFSQKVCAIFTEQLQNTKLLTDEGHELFLAEKCKDRDDLVSVFLSCG